MLLTSVIINECTINTSIFIAKAVRVASTSYLTYKNVNNK